MLATEINTVFKEVDLSQKDFLDLSSFIKIELGINLPPSKKPLLAARLKKRLFKLGLASFGEYRAFLFSPRGMEQEISHFTDAVTTNKTDFFRERPHFDYLTETAVPEILSNEGPHLGVWSAACSTGEEPYTLAMVLSEFRDKNPHLDLSFQIQATDISERVLKIAENAIYDEASVEPVPMGLRKKYLLKSLNPEKRLIRVSHEIRRHVMFRRLNLMDGEMLAQKPAHIIFLRNVIIYFDKPTQERLLKNIAACIRPGGYLFLGHAETVNSGYLPLKRMAPSVYKRLS
ncbi:MAG: CheR family methyltransferase [Deltaproteobacteria bacterium]